MKYLFFISLFLFTISCNKKYTCSCDGYEGLKSVKRYKYRAESYDSANSICQNYASGSQGNLVCKLE